MKEILFVAGNNDTHLKSIVGILHKFNNKEDYNINILNTSNFPYNTPGRTSYDILEEIKLYVKRTYSYTPNKINNNNKKLCAHIQVCRHYQKSISSYLNTLKPNLVILPNNKIFRNRFISTYCALRNIDVIVIQDTLYPGGFGDLKSYTSGFRIKFYIKQIVCKILIGIHFIRDYKIKLITKYILGHHAINKIGVWGVKSKEFAIKNSYKANQIEIIGQPRFDQINEKTFNGETEKLYKKLYLNNNFANIIYLPTKGITDGFYSSKSEELSIYVTMIEALGKIIKRTGKDIRLIVKLHRDEKIENFKKIIPNRLLKYFILIQDVPLYPLLNGCDLAITTASTAGFEALLINKPLLVVNFSGRPDFYDYCGAGAALSVYIKEDYEIKLQSLLFDRQVLGKLKKNRANFIKNEAYALDGRSADRACLIIKSQLDV